jgi:hypothetical protein
MLSRLSIPLLNEIQSERVGLERCGLADAARQPDLAKRALVVKQSITLGKLLGWILA